MKNLSVKISGKFGDLNFKFEHNFTNIGITALFGPIGSGKSTIANVIGGFNKKLKSKIFLNNNEIQGNRFLSPRLRPISIMFQEGRLIETLNVFENLKFAEEKSKIKKINSQSVNKDFIVNNLNLKDKLLKFPDSLSVGEKSVLNLNEIYSKNTKCFCR